MESDKGWLQQTWQIKEKIAEETKGFSCEQYWDFIDEHAKRALARMKRMGSARRKNRAGGA